MTKSKKFIRAALIGGASAIAMSSTAIAGEPADFDIEEGELQKALNAYIDQSGEQLIYRVDEVRGAKTEGVEGRYETDDALDVLLENTGFDARWDQSGAAVVVKTAYVQDASAGSASIFRVAQVNQADQERRALEIEPRNDETRDRADEDVVVVTGSRIRGAQNASPVTTITRQDIDLGGFATVEEILETLPQNFGAGASTEFRSSQTQGIEIGGDVRGFAGGVSVNLRGLGASSTLVLVNGRRLSAGGSEARFTNVSSIPATAIERIEVLTDGASAIYGSDAIAGVINFIMRDDYEGAETRIRYGSDLRGGTSNIQVGQAFGKSWETGNALVTYEYYNSNALAAIDRPFTNRDLTPFGGTDRRFPGGNPANIVANGQTFAIPSGQDGRSLTAADFDPAASPNLLNDREFLDQTPDIERNSVNVFLTQEISAVEFFAQARYSKEENSRRDPVGNVKDIPVTQASPFFVDPTGTGLTEVTVENYSFVADLGPQILSGEVESYGATLGARFDLSAEWGSELVANWSKEDARSSSFNLVDLDAVIAAANNPDPDLAFNPFGDGSNTNPAIFPSLRNRTAEIANLSENELWSLALNVDGVLFKGPGGKAKLAFGGEYREESLLYILPTATNPELKRDVIAVYGEVFVPLIGEANRRPGMERLELSVAGRYENYSDFGDAANPKVGLLWAPIDSLSFRGTYGTSFRAPSLPDLDGSPRAGNTSIYLSDFFVLIGLTPVPFLQTTGANEDLRPEKAVTWTAGFDWAPEFADGLSLKVTYFNIDFEDRIGTPLPSTFAALTDPRFESLVTFNPTAEQIAAVVNGPRYNPDAPFGPFSPADLISGALPVGAIVDGRRTNSARLVTRGLEVQGAYSFDTDFGAIALSFNGNYLIDFERAITPSDPLFDEVDTLGRPVDFRARGGATWSRGSWTAASYVNYTDGYTDAISNPERDVDAWTTVDLTVAYQTEKDAGLLRNARFAVTATNLFNNDPPFVDALGMGYDASNANANGRMVSFQITKDW